MSRFWKQLIGNQQGQVLPIVLAALAIGGLTIAVSLNFSTASLRDTQRLSETTRGIYAATAGIEHALWSLKNGIATDNSTPENINGMPVSISTISTGNYTLYFGELIEETEHSAYLGVAGNITWDDSAGYYRYTINVTWQAGPGYPSIKLDEIGARIPGGYSYVANSAASFPENLTIAEPDDLIPVGSAYLINWVFPPPQPDVSGSAPNASQSFYITGSGDLDNHYSWVAANRDDIGQVGEIVGELYTITARATRPGDSQRTATVVTDIIKEGSTINVMSWEISN